MRQMLISTYVHSIDYDMNVSVDVKCLEYSDSRSSDSGIKNNTNTWCIYTSSVYAEIVCECAHMLGVCIEIFKMLLVSLSLLLICII